MTSKKLQIVSCKSPVNIAVIKYWGKRNEELLLPLNDSISVTLDIKQMCAKTTVAISKDFKEDKIWLNRSETDINNPRIQNCLRQVRQKARSTNKGLRDDISEWHIHICSENNFPTAAGLASSAAGYACLAFSLAKLYGIDADISEIARIGSGSACRSIYGGFVRWFKGIKDDGSDSIARQIAPASQWPELRLLILVVNDAQKPIASTAGMQSSVRTSNLLKYRVESVLDGRIEAITNAIKNKDFETFSTITMQESNQLHAVCLDTWPPIVYLNDVSKSIINLICRFNELSGKNKVAYTFDAGPNAFLFALERDIPKIVALIRYYFPSDSGQFFQGIPVNDKVVLDPELIDKINFTPQKDAVKFAVHTKIGDGPECSVNAEDHLLDESGQPKHI